MSVPQIRENSTSETQENGTPQREYYIDESLLEDIRKFLKDAKDIKLTDEIKKMMEEMLTKLLAITDIEAFLKTVVGIGQDFLKTRSCCIFLLDKEKENFYDEMKKEEKAGGKALRIASGSGDIGEILEEKLAKYYVPIRDAITDLDERLALENDEPEFRKNLRQQFSWEERKSKVEGKLLPTGITAFVVSEANAGQTIHLGIRIKEKDSEPEKKNGKIIVEDQVVGHPEWRGLAEQEQRDACTSIIEVPLKGTNDKCIGMIKVENREGNDEDEKSIKITRKGLKHAFSSEDALKATMKDGKIFHFTNNHKKLLEEFAGYISKMLEKIYVSTERYKEIFGTQLLKRFEELDIEDWIDSTMEKADELVKLLNTEPVPIDVIQNLVENSTLNDDVKAIFSHMTADTKITRIETKKETVSKWSIRDNDKHYVLKQVGKALHFYKRIIKGKSGDTADLLSRFAFKVLAHDIIGLDNIYKKLTEVVKELNGLLELSEEYNKIIEELERFEFLMGTDIRYRDHFIHQFRVFLLGYYILVDNPEISNFLCDYLKQKIEDKIKKTELEVNKEMRNKFLNEQEIRDKVKICWFLTAAYHDIGYPIEKTPTMFGNYLGTIFPKKGFPKKLLKESIDEQKNEAAEDLLEQFQLSLPWGNVLRIYQGIFEYFKTKLYELIREHTKKKLTKDKEWQIANTLIEGITKPFHSMYSALILMHRSPSHPADESIPKEKKYELVLKEKILEQELMDLIQETILEEAVLSIMLHSDEIYSGIWDALKSLLNPEEFPFGFLLVFCDSAQEWGRPRIAELLQVSQIEKGYIDVKLREFDFQKDKIIVKLEYSEKPDKALIKEIMKPRDPWGNKIGNVRFSIWYCEKDSDDAMFRIWDV